MTDPVLTGRCFCGAIRYRGGAPLYPPTFCHCESCRRVAGAHVVAWITVSADSFAFTQGSPVEFNSSGRVFRSFCGRCGTPLTYRRDERPGQIDITQSTLDDAAQPVPIDHIYMEDALPWDRPNDGLPQYARTRPGASMMPAGAEPSAGPGSRVGACACAPAAHSNKIVDSRQ
jgi:hypothetical protein